MRPPKDIWTNNYNDFILDLYDANPFVQKDNGTVKKAPEPDKNPRKVEATPEESNGTLTTLVNESLRLRNTSLLNVKLAKNIFKWEKERLAKIKPFPDPDSLDGKKVVVIEDDDDDSGFKFPKFKFPKFRKPRFKLPKPPKPPGLPSFQPSFDFNFPWWVIPGALDNLIRQRALARAAEAARVASVAKSKQVGGSDVRTLTKAQRSALAASRSRTFSNTKLSFEELEKRAREENRKSTSRSATKTKQLGGGTTSTKSSGTAVLDRPSGSKGKSAAGRGPGFLGGTGKGIYDPRNWTNSFIDELKRRNSRWISPDALNKISQFFRRTLFEKVYGAKAKSTNSPPTTNASSPFKNNVVTGQINRLPIKKVGPTQASADVVQSSARNVTKRISTSQGTFYTNMAETNVSIEEQVEKTIKSSNAKEAAQKKATNQIINNTVQEELKKSSKTGKSISNPIKNVLKNVKNNPKAVFTGGINFGKSLGIGIALDLVADNILMDMVLRPGMNFVLSPIERMNMESSYNRAIEGGKTNSEMMSRLLREESILNQGRVPENLKELYKRFTNAPYNSHDDFIQERLRLIQMRKKFLLDKMNMTNVGGSVIDTGFITGPSSQIGGSAEYHIDTKFSDTLSDDEMIKHFDNLALGYQKLGRSIEFSNAGVAGLRWDAGADMQTKKNLLRRVTSAHAAREGYRSIDYYVPLTKSQDRFDESSEKAPILIPRIEGTTVERITDMGSYGRYVEVRDEEGNIIMKTGHGDIRYGPADGTIEIKPTSNSEDVKVVTPSSERKVSSSQINKDITVDPDSIEEEDAMMILNKLSESMQSVGTQSSMPMLLPIPMMTQNNVATIKNTNYNAWGHRIMAG